jgi:hypothetical protein
MDACLFAGRRRQATDDASENKPAEEAAEAHDDALDFKLNSTLDASACEAAPIRSTDRYGLDSCRDVYNGFA